MKDIFREAWKKIKRERKRLVRLIRNLKKHQKHIIIVI